MRNLIDEKFQFIRSIFRRQLINIFLDFQFPVQNKTDNLVINCVKKAMHNNYLKGNMNEILPDEILYKL